MFAQLFQPAEIMMSYVAAALAELLGNFVDAVALKEEKVESSSLVRRERFKQAEQSCFLRPQIQQLVNLMATVAAAGKPVLKRIDFNPCVKMAALQESPTGNSEVIRNLQNPAFRRSSSGIELVTFAADLKEYVLNEVIGFKRIAQDAVRDRANDWGITVKEQG